MKQGWVKLYRKIQDNPIWTGERFSRGQALMDIIMDSNHAPAEIVIKNRTIALERGQVLTSMSKLAIRWQWNRKTVKAFLEYLKSNSIVDYETDRNAQHGHTIITIKKYDLYQGDGQQSGQQDGQQRVSKTDTNKNIKNVKEVKKSSASKARTGKKPSKRKTESYPKEDYENIIAYYEKIKGVQLRGDEYNILRRDIKTLFMNGRTVREIRGAIWWLERSEEEWTRNWTMRTVAMKIPDIIKWLQDEGLDPTGKGGVEDVSDSMARSDEEN